jgi:hypothetical protein
MRNARIEINAIIRLQKKRQISRKFGNNCSGIVVVGITLPAGLRVAAGEQPRDERPNARPHSYGVASATRRLQREAIGNRKMAQQQKGMEALTAAMKGLRSANNLRC